MSKPIDIRALRRAEDITSASAHPEFVSGDFAIPPRRHASSMALYRSVAHDRRRAMGGTLAIAAIALLLTTVAFRSGATAGDADPQKLARPCLQWQLAASAVVSRHGAEHAPPRSCCTSVIRSIGCGAHAEIAISARWRRRARTITRWRRACRALQ